MRKNNAFDKKIVNTRLTKTFMAIFVPDERLPSSATLVDRRKYIVRQKLVNFQLHLTREYENCRCSYSLYFVEDTPCIT